MADPPFPRRVRDELIATGRAEIHHALPDSGSGARSGLAPALAERGWRLIIDARDAGDLEAARARLAERSPEVLAIAGDVTDAWHRGRLLWLVGERIDLLVNNASTLGASPLPALADLPLDVFERTLRVNVVAPLALVQLALARMPAGARILNVTSDAAVETYEGWGGYGASKAALEQLSGVLAAERPDLRVYSVDPGDMNTRMHQAAFPGAAPATATAADDVARAQVRGQVARPAGGQPVARTATCNATGRCATVRRSSPPSPAVPRCRAPGARSPTRSSRRWSTRHVVTPGQTPVRLASPRVPGPQRPKSANPHRAATVGPSGAAHSGASAPERRAPITPAGPGHGLRAVDGLLTGWQEPEATHLLMLEAVGGCALVADSYRAALERGYLWHEFGDVHLLLP